MTRPVALITGGSRGIGRACARALANGYPSPYPLPQGEGKQQQALLQEQGKKGRDGAQEQGFDLALQYHQNASAAEELAAELKSSGARVETFAADLSQKGTAAGLVEAVAEKLGPPVVLIHAAGAIIEKPLAFTSADDFSKMLELHALSAACLSQAMLRYIRKSDRGRIVLIGSLAGEIGLGNASAYAAAKGALNGLCRSLALEVARWKATVNVIAPGYVSTDMTAAQDAQRRAQLEKQIPLERFASPEEIAALAAFLCSREAGYITGQTIVVDGGMSLG
ncbi:MAG TPA: SDR family NAD(P)-dependent oxidoreductase [Planctomycetota bacterium]|nr:SDR family NAD(P)-dependent oxidoreductase [Planctomycetota bacterium]